MDTHDGFASTAPLDDLRRRDLLPCVELAGSGAAVMVGHLDVPDLTEPGLPASLSPAASTGLLRDEYGDEDGLVFTDASAWMRSPSATRCRRPPSWR